MTTLPAANELAAFSHLAARLLANPDARRPGSRRVRGRAGAGVEHLEHREFRSGDELRYVDWRLSARRQRLIVRERQAESGGDWWICLDASSSMVSADAVKWRAAVQCAAAVAYALIDLGHRVGLLAFADDIVANAPCGRGHAQFARLARRLQALAPPARGAASQLASCAARIHTQSSCFVLSDFLRADNMQRDLALLRARSVDVHALSLACAGDQRLPLDQHLTLVDVETGAQLDSVPSAALQRLAEQALAARSAALRAYCAQDSIHFSCSDAAAGWRGALVHHLLHGPRH
jgi:uncharacterized protein (DUF58 family)